MQNRQDLLEGCIGRHGLDRRSSRSDHDVCTHSVLGQTQCMLRRWRLGQRTIYVCGATMRAVVELSSLSVIRGADMRSSQDWHRNVSLCSESPCTPPSAAQRVPFFPRAVDLISMPRGVVPRTAQSPPDEAPNQLLRGEYDNSANRWMIRESSDGRRTWPTDRWPLFRDAHQVWRDQFGQAPAAE